MTEFSPESKPSKGWRVLRFIIWLLVLVLYLSFQAGVFTIGYNAYTHLQLSNISKPAPPAPLAKEVTAQPASPAEKGNKFHFNFVRGSLFGGALLLILGWFWSTVFILRGIGLSKFTTGVVVLITLSSFIYLAFFAPATTLQKVVSYNWLP